MNIEQGRMAIVHFYLSRGGFNYCTFVEKKKREQRRQLMEGIVMENKHIRGA